MEEEDEEVEEVDDWKEEFGFDDMDEDDEDKTK